MIEEKLYDLEFPTGEWFTQKDTVNYCNTQYGVYTTTKNVKESWQMQLSRLFTITMNETYSHKWIFPESENGGGMKDGYNKSEYDLRAILSLVATAPELYTLLNEMPLHSDNPEKWLAFEAKRTEILGKIIVTPKCTELQEVSPIETFPPNMEVPVFSSKKD